MCEHVRRNLPPFPLSSPIQPASSLVPLFALFRSSLLVVRDLCVAASPYPTYPLAFRSCFSCVLWLIVVVFVILLSASSISSSFRSSSSSRRPLFHRHCLRHLPLIVLSFILVVLISVYLCVVCVSCVVDKWCRPSDSHRYLVNGYGDVHAIFTYSDHICCERFHRKGASGPC